MKGKAAAEEVWYPSRDTEGQVPHDPPGHIFEVTSVSFNKEAGTSLGMLGLFCGLWNLWTGSGTSSVACLETWSKRSRSRAFSEREWVIYRNILVFALLVKQHSSWRKVAISSVLAQQKAQHIFLLPHCRRWADEQTNMNLEHCMVLLLKCSWLST